jgi:hypothetical protein
MDEVKKLWKYGEEKSLEGGKVINREFVSTIVRKMIFFYQSICHPFRLLKIPQIAILGDLHCLKGSCFNPFTLLVGMQTSTTILEKNVEAS